MKKLTAILIATLMMITIFAGCSSAPATPVEEQGPSDTELATAAAEAKVDEMKDFLAQSLEDTIASAELVPESVKSQLSEGEVAMYEQKLNDIVSSIINGVDISVDSVEVDGDEGTASLLISMANVEEIFSADVLTALTEKATTDLAGGETLINSYLAMLDEWSAVIENAETMSQVMDITLEKTDGEWIVASAE